MQLVIGNKRYSTWSMRPWLLMKTLQLPFEERQLPYHTTDWHAQVKRLGGNASVPFLVDGDDVVSDSLAIVETLHERFADAGVWPREARARALARSLSAQMHSGFFALRNECSMDLLRVPAPRPLSDGVRAELQRVESVFAHADGGFLFGDFSAVDAMYAPIVCRILTYQLPIEARFQPYLDRIRHLPAMHEWIAGAQRERDWPPVAPGGAPWPSITGAVDAEAFARRWIAAWNARDLDAVLGMFAAAARFTSPKAAAFLGRPCVEGIDDLRAYWSLALQRVGELRFEYESALFDASANTIVVRYVAALGDVRTRAAEVWKLDGAGRIVDGDALYGAPV